MSLSCFKNENNLSAILMWILFFVMLCCVIANFCTGYRNVWSNVILLLSIISAAIIGVKSNNNDGILCFWNNN